MDEKLKKDIEALVAEIFSQREEADKIGKTEKALIKSAETIEELTSVLEAKNSELEVASLKISDLDNIILDLTSKLEAAKNEVGIINTKLVESDKIIDGMRKDKVAEIRMSELIAAKVVYSDKVVQVAKIREMADDEFNAYKNELVAIRQAIVKELEKTVVPLNSGDASNNILGVNNGENTSISPPPVDVTADKKMAAALNLETDFSDNIVTKYKVLGETMAARINKKKKE